MPDALSLPRSELPEEIVKAIEAFEDHAFRAGTDDCTASIRDARSALTTSILSRLTAAEAGREEAESGKDRLAIEAARLEIQRDVALARAEKLEKALAEFGEQAPAIGANALCPFNDEGALDLPDNFDAADPCPICGDLGSHDNGGRPVRCIAKDRR